MAKLQAGVIAGTKTTTIRKTTCRVQKGEVVAATGRNYQVIAYLYVTGTQELTRADIVRRANVLAESDGIESGAVLVEALARIYPRYRTLLLIRFRLATNAEVKAALA